MRRIDTADSTAYEELTRVQAALAEPNPALLAAALGGTASARTDSPELPSQDAGPARAANGPLSVLACAVGGTPVGYAIVLSGDTVYLPELAVRPDRQREGHGTALVRAVCERYRSRSTVRLAVAASDQDARRFYARLRFAPVDRLPGHFESGDALVLERAL